MKKKVPTIFLDSYLNQILNLINLLELIKLGVHKEIKSIYHVQITGIIITDRETSLTFIIAKKRIFISERFEENFGKTSTTPSLFVKKK